MRKHPLLIIAAFFALGILLFDTVHPPLYPSFALLGASLLFSALFRNRRISTIFIFIAMTAAGGLNFWAQFRERLHPALKEIPTYQKIRVFGVVKGRIFVREDYIRFPLSLTHIQKDSAWQPVQGKLLVTVIDSTLRISENEKLYVSGNLVWPIGARNPGGFDYKRYLRQRGVQARLRVRRDGSILKLGEAQESIWAVDRYVGQARNYIESRLETISAPATRSLMRGLLLGDRSEIDPEITEDFARSGIIHILAVSGLHVGLLMGFCFGLATLLGLRQRQVFLLILAVVWFYALITGLKPPVTRASLMATLFLLGKLRDRQTNGMNIVGASAFIVLLFRPGDLFQVGFQFSFSAVFGILLLYPRFESALKRLPAFSTVFRHGIGRYVIGILFVSLAAQIGTLPFSAWHFGRVSLVGVVANLLAIPLVTLLLPLSLIFLAAAILPPSVSAWVEIICQFLARSIIFTGDYFGKMAFASVDNWHPPIWILLLYISMVALLFYGNLRKVRFLAILVLLFSLNLQIWPETLDGRPKLRVTVLDIGQGDCIFVEFPNDKTLLIDAGPASPEFDAGEQLILPFLRRRGIEKIDMALVSHPHLDHFGGLAAIAASIPIQHVVFADTGYVSGTFRTFLQKLEKQKTPISIVKRGNIIEDFAPARLLILGPTPAAAKRRKRLNEASISVQIRYGKTAFLFTGDAEDEGEAALLPFGDLLKSQFLKAGHHGSGTSSEETLLQRVRPRWTAISLGAMNRFGHPDREVTARLARLGSDTLRTDLNGALRFVSDGRTIERRN